MKQVLQHLRTGRMELADVPAACGGGSRVLIRSRASLISAGTERMLVEFSQASLIQKARQQPDKVKKVLDKIRSDGLVPTLETVFTRLDEPMPLGYCNVGVVENPGDALGNGHMFRKGDRVLSNGPHAEMVCVPRNLCAVIPEGVSDEAAAFTVLGAIGLQGVRLVKPEIGEKVAVVGLGLVGLLTVQLLKAGGCDVLGIDIDPDRLAIAERFGATVVNGSETDAVTAANSFSNGKGMDAVVITASAKTDQILHEAAEMSRKRGRIVLVGVVGLNLRRSDFYEKELSFQVSCSYGPGRYDERYEEGGQDYPYGYVRWTEKRNFEAVLDMIADGQIDVEPLISHRFPLSDAQGAYSAIQESPDALGVILQYGDEPQESLSRTSVTIKEGVSAGSDGRPVVAIIGAGGFAKMIMLPSLGRTNAQIAYVCDLDGVAAQHLARKHEAEKACTDYREILDDSRVEAVFIAVGHSLHARFVSEALAAGKHVFVEKPLAMNDKELSCVIKEYNAASANAPRQLMTGFNRRFSPHVIEMKKRLAGRSEPLAMSFTANAGIIPPDDWVHDPVKGGGRIIGEACHFIDLMVHLTGSRVTTVAAIMMGEGVAVHEDKMSISLGFEDGSVGTVNYFANGPKSYPKEQMEVFSEGRVLKMDNFRALRGTGFAGFRKFSTGRQDKGHRAEFAMFVKLLSDGGESLIPLNQQINATLASFAAMTAARERRTINLDEEYSDIRLA